MFNFTQILNSKQTYINALIRHGVSSLAGAAGTYGLVVSNDSQTQIASLAASAVMFGLSYGASALQKKLQKVQVAAALNTTPSVDLADQAKLIEVKAS